MHPTPAYGLFFEQVVIHTIKLFKQIVLVFLKQAFTIVRMKVHISSKQLIKQLWLNKL